MKPTAAHKTLLPHEKATLTPADLALPGWLPVSRLNLATLGFGLALMALLPMAYWPLGWVLARLAALDLTTYTLPDVYTLPLVAVGVAQAVYTGEYAPPAAAAVVLLAWVALPQAGRGFGGGDFKLLAALLSLLSLQNAAFAVAMGCIAWLPFALARPRAMHPFGVPLLIGWAIILRFPHLPEALLRPMFHP